MQPLNCYHRAHGALNALHHSTHSFSYGHLMATTQLEQGRITARLSQEARATLTLAAEMAGTTINQFLLQTALREAERLIEQERVIRLSAQDSAAFLNALDHPPGPNTALLAALGDHANRYHAKTGTLDSLDWTPQPKRI